MPLDNDAGTYLELSLHETGRESCRPDKEFHFTPKSYHLFHYVTKGKGTFEAEGKTYRLKRGSIFYIAPGQIPYYYPDPEEPWSYEWLGFYGSRAEGFLESLGITKESPIYPDPTMKLKGYFDAISSEYAEKGKINLLCLGHAYTLFGEMMNDAGKGLGDLNLRQAHLLAAKEYIHNNYQFQITIIDVAANVGLSPNYLAALFREYEGMSTKSYLTNVRMEKAGALLTAGGRLIKDVARLTGYKNQLHFSGEFRKYFGCAPRDYAREVK